MMDNRAAQPLLAALREKHNVMTAVMLRDMRTRFFNQALGFLVVSLWPLAHMLILITIYTLLRRSAPFGGSLPVFFATDLIPSLTFMYVSRFMCMSLVLNRPMLAFPVMKVLDIMAARVILEIIAAFLTLSMILVYILPGTLFVASALLEEIAYHLSFNPVLHAIEWVRLSYYEGYSTRLLDKEYLIVFGLASLCLGLLLERVLRRVMLES